MLGTDIPDTVEKGDAMDEGRLSILRPSSLIPWRLCIWKKCQVFATHVKVRAIVSVPVPILWSCHRLVINWHPSCILSLVGQLWIYLFSFGHTACRILFPWPGINPPSAVDTWSLNCWTTRSPKQQKFSAIPLHPQLLEWALICLVNQKSYCLALGIGVGSPGLNESNTQLFLALGMIVIMAS